MKIKVSKVFAKHIEKVLDIEGYKVEVTELTDDQYQALVGESVYTAEQWGDFNYKTRATKAIRIEYPEDYYALPRYLSTREINQMFKGISTIEELNTEIVNALTI